MALEIESGELYAENMSVQELLALESGYSVSGFNLTDKSFLLGVPFVVTGIRFQLVPPPTKSGEQQRGYVTCEAAIYPETEVKRQLTASRITHYHGNKKFTTPESMEELKVSPEERIVFNDGSTGVRRQLVHLLHNYGFIAVTDAPKIDERDPILDIPWTEWKSVGAQTTVIGEEMAPYICRTVDGTKPLTLRCPRGLRVSDYDNPMGGGDRAETYYFG